jgi:two-component system sensor histidine kinase YesM
MILAIFFAIMIPFLIVGFAVVHEFRESALNEAIEQTEKNVERVRLRTAEVLNVSVELSNRLSLDSRLEDVANRRYETTYEVVETYREYDTIRTFLDFNKEVSKIKLYVDNPTIISNWELFPLEESTKNTFWYQSALSGRGLNGWYYFQDVTRSFNSKLSLIRKVNFPEYRSEGVLVIDVNTDYINSILRQESFETVILDENKMIVASNRPGMIGRLLDETHLAKGIAFKESGTHEVMINNKDSRVFIEEFVPETSYNKLKVISVFSIDSIMSEANRISYVGFTVILISFIIALLLIYIICSILVKRLLGLSKQITKVSTGNFDSALLVDGNDEIGQLSRQFNQMVYNIKELMSEVEHSHEQKNQLEVKQNEIKLKMLASQINPHFLYNALESIRMKAHIRGEKEIAQTVKLLGKLMRKNLEISGKLSLLEDEIEMVRCYLEIQKFRHDERLEYELDLDPKAMQTLIPPLIIQPLVENAVIHGLERKNQGGKITVRVKIADRFLEIEVLDNGVGIPEEKLDAIRLFLDNQEGNRIGLSNVHQRIQLTYGTNYGLRIDSGDNTGTKISFIIPREG